MKKVSKGFINSFLYASGNYIFRISSSLTAIFVTRLLGPSMAGVISYVNVLDRNFSTLFYGPLRLSIDREYPKLYNSKDKGINFINTVFFYNLFLAFIVSIFYLIYAFYTQDSLLTKALFYFSLINIFKSLSDYFKFYSKATLNFVLIAKVFILLAILQPILLIPVTYYLKLDGYYISRLIIFSLNVFLFAIWSKDLFLHVKFIKLKFLKKIYLSGGALLINGIFITLFFTLDQLFIKRFYPIKDLGYYSIGTMIFQVSVLLPDSILGAFFPKFITKEGNQYITVHRLSSLINWITALSISFVLLVLPSFFKLILPKFLPGLLPAKILIFALLFYGNFQMFFYEFVRKKKMKYVHQINTLTFIVTIGFYILFVSFGISSVYIAIIPVLNFLILSILYKYFANKVLFDLKKWKNVFNDFYFVLLFLPYWILDYLFHPSLIMDLIKFLVSTVIILFGAFLANKKYHFTEIVFAQKKVSQ